MLTICRRLLRSETGATAIEYCLIVALMALGMMTGLSVLGGGSSGLWGQIMLKVAGVMSG